MTEVRKLDADDVDLLDAAIKILRDHGSPAPEMFLRDPHAHAFVAIDGGDSTDAQRLQRWSDLLDEFVAFARAKGHSRMWLFTDAGDAAARRLYAGAGGERRTDSMGYWWVFE